MMRIIRWLCFWPVAVVSGLFVAGLVSALLGLVFGWWWPTACLAIFAALFVQPIVTLVVACRVAPTINKWVGRSILVPFWFLWLFAAINVVRLLFGSYEGQVPESTFYAEISPWWYSLSSNLGFMWGYGLTGYFWDEFLSAMSQYATNTAEESPAMKERETTIHHHQGLLTQKPS